MESPLAPSVLYPENSGEIYNRGYQDGYCAALAALTAAGVLDNYSTKIVPMIVCSCEKRSLLLEKYK